MICAVLVVLILKQSKEDNGASGTVMGAGANNFYEKNIKYFLIWKESFSDNIWN